jgi:hypothetical protein
MCNIMRPNTLDDIYRKLDALSEDEYGCKVWPKTGLFEYPRVGLNNKVIKVSRLVLERKLGRPITPGYCALHHCDYPPCVSENHLYEGMRSDNLHDVWNRNLEYAEAVRASLRKINQSPEHKERARQMGKANGLRSNYPRQGSRTDG